MRGNKSSVFNINFSSYSIILLLFSNLELIYSVEPVTENPNFGGGDYIIGPDYVIDSDLKDNGNPKGRNFQFAMPLANSNIYRGTDA